MVCEFEKMPLLLDGGLPLDDRLELYDHLDNCKACFEMVYPTALRDIRNLLRVDGAPQTWISLTEGPAPRALCGRALPQDGCLLIGEVRAQQIIPLGTHPRSKSFPS